MFQHYLAAVQSMHNVLRCVLHKCFGLIAICWCCIWLEEHATDVVLMLSLKVCIRVSKADTVSCCLPAFPFNCASVFVVKLAECQIVKCQTAPVAWLVQVPVLLAQP